MELAPHIVTDAAIGRPSPSDLTPRSPWLVLAVLCVSVFVIVVDAAVVGVGAVLAWRFLPSRSATAAGVSQTR